MVKSYQIGMTDTSWAERAVLAVLMAASLGLFGYRFRKVLEAIRLARPTPDFRLAPLAPRIRQFLWEVALQGKVIRQRPLPGLAHAFVFWGFCAFALITLNHLASGFGVGFLTPGGGFGRFYFGFVAAWAVAVAVSIAGLFVRRFVVRPVWLGPVSPESGVIALLIFVLMVTYLAGLRLGEAGPAVRANWWLHTAALLLFLPLIPHTKHLHLALSPVTVFLRRQGFSRIPPLAGDEDFGLDTRQGRDAHRRPAGLLLRGMRPLHRALPRVQHRKDAEPEGNRSGAARLSQRMRSRQPKRRCWARTFPRRPRSSAPPAARASFNAPWGSSICP